MTKNAKGKGSEDGKGKERMRGEDNNGYKT